MKHNTKRLVRAALIAGIYVALCLVQQPLAYGPVQFRVSEALTLLPIFTPDAVWAVTVGCFLSNLFSMSPWDMLFGTLATLLAAIATRMLRNIRVKGLPVLAPLPPVLFNAVIIGFEIAFLSPGGFIWPAFWGAALSVGLGEFAVCCLLGLPFAAALGSVIRRSEFLSNLFH